MQNGNGVSGHLGVWLSSWSHLPCDQPHLLILLGLLLAAFVLFCPGKLHNWLSSWPFSSRSPNLLFPFLISSNGHSEAASPLCPAQVSIFSHSLFRVRDPEIATSPRKLHGSSHSSPVTNVPGQYLHAWLRFLWYWFMSAPKGLKSGCRHIELSTLGYPKAIGECFIYTLKRLGALWSLCSWAALTEDA